MSIDYAVAQPLRASVHVERFTSFGVVARDVAVIVRDKRRLARRPSRSALVRSSTATPLVSAGRGTLGVCVWVRDGGHVVDYALLIFTVRAGAAYTKARAGAFKPVAPGC